MNIVIIKGRLAGEPTQRALGTSTIVNFCLCNSKREKQANGEYAEKTIFIDCEIWGKSAEYVMHYCTKGTGVLIQGELIVESYTSNSGEKRRKSYVRVNVVEIISQSQNRGQQAQAQGQTGAQTQQVKPFQSVDDYKRQQASAVADEDIPF